jgi:cold shock CspA family protein
MHGTIMRFDNDKGYGFIKPDAGGSDLFMHVSELRRLDPHNIKPTVTRVTYEEADSGRGPKAVSVFVTDAQDTEPEPEYEGEPVQPTTAAWRALWDRHSDEAFAAMLAQARANGWVQDV